MAPNSKAPVSEDEGHAQQLTSELAAAHDWSDLKEHAPRHHLLASPGRSRKRRRAVTETDFDDEDKAAAERDLQARQEEARQASLFAEELWLASSASEDFPSEASASDTPGPATPPLPSSNIRIAAAAVQKTVYAGPPALASPERYAAGPVTMTPHYQPGVRNNVPGFRYGFRSCGPTPASVSDEVWSRVYNTANTRVYFRCKEGSKAAYSTRMRESGETRRVALEVLAEHRAREGVLLGGVGAVER